jgi:hypothetical protein
VASALNIKSAIQTRLGIHSCMPAYLVLLGEDARVIDDLL